MSEPRGSMPEAVQSDVHDLEAVAESSSEVLHLAALDYHTGVCEWTVSCVIHLVLILPPSKVTFLQPLFLRSC